MYSFKHVELKSLLINFPCDLNELRSLTADSRVHWLVGQRAGGQLYFMGLHTNWNLGHGGQLESSHGQLGNV